MPIFTELTPNPMTKKFLIDPPEIARGRCLELRGGDDGLLGTLFDIGARSLFFGPDFVSVTIKQGIGWDIVEPQAKIALADADLRELAMWAFSPAEDARDSEIIKRIKEVLNERIRPALMHDGGNAYFHSFKEGKLKLSLVGACAGCPSALATLKMGIERLFKAAIPDVESVEAAAGVMPPFHSIP